MILLCLAKTETTTDCMIKITKFWQVAWSGGTSLNFLLMILENFNFKKYKKITEFFVLKFLMSLLLHHINGCITIAIEMTLKSSLSLQELDFISMHIKYSWQNLWLNERPCWPVMQAWFALWSRQRQVPLAAGQLVVATLRRRCEHHIFALWFLLCTFFFSRLFSAVTDWMSTYFHTWP